MRSNNASVRAFLDKINTLTVRSGARTAISRKIEEQAQRLANDIRSAAPVKTGKLRSSVRVEVGKSGRRDGDAPLQFIVKAGGALTTVAARSGSSATYDYSMATEFGTSKEAAQPFFFTTARADEAKIAREIERTIDKEFSR